MTSEVLVFTANVLQSCVPLLSLVAYLPQWKKLVETKSSKDISLESWVIWSASTAFALFYAVVQYLDTGRGMALVFSTCTGLVFILATVYLIFIYREGNRETA